MTTIAMQQQAEQYLQQLTPETLAVATDFLAYLVQKEEDNATQELLNIKGFKESFERGKQQVAEGKVTNWRNIRHTKQPLQSLKNFRASLPKVKTTSVDIIRQMRDEGY
jgi:hypothetical protein